MEHKKSSYSNVLFRYMDVPSCGWVGEDDGGFSIDIYPNGDLIYKTYIYDEIEKTRTIFEIDSKSIEQIMKVLATYEQSINQMDEYLDNGSDDGDENIFIINGKKIITWNIEYSDENELKKTNQKYYEKYLSVIRQEKILLEVFYQISKILKTQGIKLRLYNVIFQKVSIRKNIRKIKDKIKENLLNSK